MLFAWNISFWSASAGLIATGFALERFIDDFDFDEAGTISAAIGIGLAWVDVGTVGRTVRADRRIDMFIKFLQEVLDNNG